MLPKALVIVGVIVLVVLSAGFGYNLGQRRAIPSTSPVGQASFFNSQSATVRGTITSQTGNTVEIKNNKGTAEKFELLKGATFASFDRNRKLSSPSADLKLLKLNKEAIFTLRRSGEVYKVVAVNYLP